MAGVSHEIDQLIIRLAPETLRQRQSALLRPLNNSLIVITLVGITVTLLGSRNPAGLLIMGLSLVVNLVVAALNWRGSTRAAAYLFSIWMNLGILWLVANNLLVEQSLANGVLFACQFALSVMLAGMLLGIPRAVAFLVVDVVAIWSLLYVYTTSTMRAASGIVIYEGITQIGVPVTAFLVLIVVITWLHQRALRQAEERVEAARTRIIQDELMRRDLALARELQLRLFPAPPLTTPDLRIATRTEPARETSGDFYDFVELGEGTLGMIVADVTGKSVAAALMMALARVTIRSEARRYTSPAEVLRAANETICRDHTARQLITAFYGVLDTRAMTLRFANAGHPYPILRRGSHLVEVELVGVPLGGRAGTEYGEQIIQLEPGDQLFLISDGLVEERNASREMFGYTRLGTTILAADPHDPERAAESLWQAVTQFRGAVDQSDDITLVVVQAAPTGPAPLKSLPATVAHQSAHP
jgi:serine phosphatase RsbU (regulator of sigma subunit)